VGVGFFKHTPMSAIRGQKLPNTEAPRIPITDPRAQYRPMSLGALGRNFEERLKYAGTYDAQWLETTYPFLPSDFDPRYYQCAPADQQIDYPRGGEAVRLLHLTPQGQLDFQLPDTSLEVEFNTATRGLTQVRAVVDTVIIEPSARRLSLVWRASLPLRKTMHEVNQVVVGRMSKAWYRARENKKVYYRSLGELVARGASE
jgi:hypothetical protein